VFDTSEKRQGSGGNGLNDGGRIIAGMDNEGGSQGKRWNAEEGTGT